jgi:hypothetical protein
MRFLWNDLGALYKRWLSVTSTSCDRVLATHQPSPPSRPEWHLHADHLARCCFVNVTATQSTLRFAVFEMCANAVPELDAGDDGSLCGASCLSNHSLDARPTPSTFPAPTDRGCPRRVQYPCQIEGKVRHLCWTVAPELKQTLEHTGDHVLTAGEKIDATSTTDPSMAQCKVSFTKSLMPVATFNRLKAGSHRSPWDTRSINHRGHAAQRPPCPLYSRR